MTAAPLLAVDWPAPAGVHAFTTSRRGGVSEPPYHSLNLSTSSGDDALPVAHNVRALVASAGLPESPRWPRQVHGTRVLASEAVTDGESEADAVYTTRARTVCTVRTADCLPVLLCDRNASVVAAAHAGWRGLAAGVLEATVSALPVPPECLMAWLGPAIGPGAYEVGDEVRAAFLDRDAQATGAFRPSPAGRWLADLYALARRRLHQAGVLDTHGGGWCTHDQDELFFSYRRDGVTGRMASGIWLAGR